MNLKQFANAESTQFCPCNIFYCIKVPGVLHSCYCFQKVLFSNSVLPAFYVQSRQHVTAVKVMLLPSLVFACQHDNSFAQIFEGNFGGWLYFGDADTGTFTAV